MLRKINSQGKTWLAISSETFHTVFSVSAEVETEPFHTKSRDCHPPQTGQSEAVRHCCRSCYLHSGVSIMLSILIPTAFHTLRLHPCSCLSVEVPLSQYIVLRARVPLSAAVYLRSCSPPQQRGTQ